MRSTFFLSTLYSFAVENTLFKFVVASLGSTVTFLWGGWDRDLSILAGAVILDYLTGVGAAIKEKKLSSKIGSAGIAAKITLFGLVAIAHWFDQMMGSGDFLRTFSIWFFVANEALSVVENAERLGLKIPPQLRDTINAFKEDNSKKGRK